MELASLDYHAGVVSRGVHFGDRVGAGPEIKNLIGFRGILEAPISDISGVGDFGFRGFSGRVFGAPDFDFVF